MSQLSRPAQRAELGDFKGAGVDKVINRGMFDGPQLRGRSGGGSAQRSVRLRGRLIPRMDIGELNGNIAFEENGV